MKALIFIPQVLACVVMLTPMACAQRPATIEGDVFIVTKGAQSIKLGAIEVRVLQTAEIDALRERRGTGRVRFTELPGALRTATTNADGHFSVEVPAGNYALAAQAERRVGYATEKYFWLVPVAAQAGGKAPVSLTNRNLADSNSDYVDLPEKIAAR